MELKFSARTVARLEDDDMLGASPMSVFFGDLSDQDEVGIRARAMEVFMSVKKLVMIIGAGYDNDIEKAYEVFDEEIKGGRSQLEIGSEVFEALQNGGFLGGAVEKKVPEGSIPSVKSGKQEK